MSLALVGNQSTKELTEWVCKYFACVPSSRVRSKDLNDLMGAGIGKGEPPFLHEDFCILFELFSSAFDLGKLSHFLCLMTGFVICFFTCGVWTRQVARFS